MNTYLNGCRIPERMMTPLKAYIDHGSPVGGFLYAVLSNNLSQAIGRADSENLANLPAYIGYLWNEAPALCWGSEAHVEAWINSKVKRAVE